jgi:hypothetical protein
MRPRRAVLGLFVVAAAIAATAARSAESGSHYERPLTPAGPGANRAAVDVPLLAGSAPMRYAKASAGGRGAPELQGGLEDLRLYTGSGREVPYLLLRPPVREERWERVSLLAIPATKASSGFEVELESPRTADRVRLEELPTPFLKRFRLEGSGDRARWTVLVPEGTLFDLPDEKLRRVEASFPPGVFRYLRVTWDDRTSGRVPLPRSASVRVGEEPALLPAERAPVAFSKAASEPGRSRYHLKLPGAHLPVVALDLGVGPGHVLREAKVTEPRLAGGEVMPHQLGGATLRQTTREAGTASDLRIPIDFPSGPDLDLVVADGDNPPFDLRSVDAVFASLPAIWFETPSAEPLVARFGNPTLSAPHYDLEAARVVAGRTAAGEARWGAVRDVVGGAPSAPASLLPEFGAAVDRSGFGRFRTIFAVKSGLNAVPLDAAVLAHGTLASLRIVGEQGRQVPYLLERRDEPLTLELGAPERLARESGPPNVSSYRIGLPFAGLPASRLVLSTSARVFARPISVTVARRDVRRREEWIETLARAAWRHADPETPAPPLVLELPPLGITAVTLSVDEGDNSPLPLAPPRLLLPSYRLRFFAGSDEARTLLYGEPSLASPRYDLALLAPRLVGVSSNDAALGPEEVNTVPAAGANDRKLFWGVLVAAVLALLLVLGRLLRPGATPSAPRHEG